MSLDTQETEEIVIPTPVDDTDDELVYDQRVSPVPVVPQLSIALGLLVLVFGVTYIGAQGTIASKKGSDDVRVETKLISQTQEALSLSSAYKNLTLGAKSAIVWDVQEQRVLFNKNADEVRPLASITKLMTALVSYELLDPTDTVPITLSSLEPSGDSGFVDGETFTMQNLSDLTLIESSNDGATALGASVGNSITAESDPNAVFVKAMNIKANELGLTKTHFKNSTGLDLSPTEAGAYGSARDVAHLMEYIVTNITDAVALTNLGMKSIKNKDGAYHVAKNTNEVVDDIQGLIASKTGYTALSGGNLVVAVNMGLNRPIVTVVLGSSENGRFADTLELIERTRLYIESEGE